MSTYLNFSWEIVNVYKIDVMICNSIKLKKISKEEKMYEEIQKLMYIIILYRYYIVLYSHDLCEKKTRKIRLFRKWKDPN